MWGSSSLFTGSDNGDFPFSTESKEGMSAWFQVRSVGPLRHSGLPGVVDDGLHAVSRVFFAFTFLYNRFFVEYTNYYIILSHPLSFSLGGSNRITNVVVFSCSKTTERTSATGSSSLPSQAPSSRSTGSSR